MAHHGHGNPEQNFYWVDVDRRKEPTPFLARLHYTLDPGADHLRLSRLKGEKTRVSESLVYCRFELCAAACADLGRLWALEDFDGLNSLEETYQMNFPAQVYLQLDIWSDVQSCKELEDLKDLFKSWEELAVNPLYTALERAARAPVLPRPARCPVFPRPARPRAASPETPPSLVVSPVPSPHAGPSLSAAVELALNGEQADQVLAPENLPPPSPHVLLSPPPVAPATVAEQESEAADGLLQMSDFTSTAAALGSLKSAVGGDGAGPSKAWRTKKKKALSPAFPPAHLVTDLSQLKKAGERREEELFQQRRREQRGNRKRKAMEPRAKPSQQTSPKRANTQQDLPTETPAEEEMPTHGQDDGIIEDSQPQSDLQEVPESAAGDDADATLAALNAFLASSPNFMQLSSILESSNLFMMDGETNETAKELELKTIISENAAALEEKDMALKEAEKALKEKDAALKEKDAALKEKETALKEAEKDLKEKNKDLHKKGTALEEKDAALEEKGMALEEAEKALKEKDAALKEAEKDLKQKNKDLQKKGTALKEKDTALKKAKKSLAEANAAIALKDQEIVHKDSELEKMGEEIKTLEEDAVEYMVMIEEKKRELEAAKSAEGTLVAGAAEVIDLTN